MDFNELLKLGAEIIKNNDDETTSKIDTSKIAGALSQVLGGGENQLDIAGLVKAFANKGLMGIVQSWLGEGENAPVDPEKVESALGSEKISAFAKELGISHDSAKQALSDAIPTIVDKATPPGSVTLSSLLDELGNTKGVMKMINKLF
ncbi:YidB family protein [Desulfurobacterium sp.]